MLIGRFRAAAAVSALLLIVVAWGGAGASRWSGAALRAEPCRAGRPGLVGVLVLNSAGNLATSHPVERWVKGPTTVVLAVLVAIVALPAL